jgi:hypothetical protein
VAELIIFLHTKSLKVLRQIPNKPKHVTKIHANLRNGTPILQIQHVAWKFQHQHMARNHAAG